MYVLYGGDFTRAPLVQWVLDEGGIGYEFRKIDIVKDEHRAPEFLAINPAGLVPVLITPEGDALYEVAALMVYLADRHQLTDLAPAVTAAIQDMSKQLVLSRLEGMNTRLAKGGPYVLGSRFSLADFYLSFWIAYLDREAVCKRFPWMARLYDLVRSRPGATSYIEATERSADAYAELMKKNPGGVIA